MLVNAADAIVLSGFDVSRAVIFHPDITFGPSLTIRTQNGSGTIGRDVAWGWGNQGTIRVSGPNDELLLTGHWDNNGLIDVVAGTLLLDGNITADSFGTINREPEAMIRMHGNLDLEGQTLDLDTLGFGDLVLGDTTTISNGTIAGTLATLRTHDVVQSNITLNNVTIATEFEIASRARVRMPNGLHLDGGTVFLGSEPPGAADLIIGLTEGRFISGTGEVVFNGATAFDDIEIPTNGMGRFAVGDGITIRTGRSGGEIDYGQGWMDLMGTLSAQTQGETLRVIPFWVNSSSTVRNLGGLLRAVDGGTLDIALFEGELGNFEVANGGHLILGGNVEQDRTWVLDQGGWLEIENTIDLVETVEVSNGSRLTLLDFWSSVQSVVIDGGTLEIANLPNLGNALPTIISGRLILRGEFSRGQLDVFDLTQTVLELGESTHFINNQRLLDAGGSIAGLEMSGGRIVGGSIRSAYSTPLLVTAGDNELDGVLLFDDLHVQGGEIRLLGGTVVNGQILIDAGSGPFNRGTLVSNRGLIAVRGTNSIVTFNAFTTENIGEIEVASGHLHLLGNLELAESSTLSLHLGSDANSVSELVRVNNDISLDGLLAITIDEDLDLAFGDRFQLITAQNFTGIFSEIALPEIAEIWDTSLLETAGLLQVISIDGDLTGDGFVNGADLDVILANWGQSVLLGDRLRGDHSGDGLVGNADLQVVIDNWGSNATDGGNVPEPGTLTSLLIAIVVSSRRRHKHLESATC